MWVVLSAPVAMRSAESNPAPGKIDYGRDVRPILSKNCLPCHGPDEKNRQVGLRLDLREVAVADRGGYRVIVPGRSSGSRLVERITHPTLPMPPAATGKKLTADEIELLKKWIDQGASYSRRWAFERPVRPPLPEVKAKSWPKNEIDYFVMARREAEGMSPSPEADSYTLIRRVYLDLIGIPPTPEQVDAFVKDEEPGAYERVVVELLNSPRYGERWARVGEVVFTLSYALIQNSGHLKGGSEYERGNPIARRPIWGGAKHASQLRRTC